MSTHHSHFMEKGFTLVETLVAISILLVVIISPMTIAQKGIQNAYFATEQVTAVFLAQEAIEAVRMYRDGEALIAHEETYVQGNAPTIDTGEWANALISRCGSGDGCRYEPPTNNILTSDSFTSCSQVQGSCRLNVNSEGLYSYAIGTPSAFTRTVQIIDRTAGLEDAVEVIVQVSWQGKIFGGATRTVELRTWVYDQYKRFGTP